MMRSKSSFRQHAIIAGIVILLVASLWLTVATFRLVGSEGGGSKGGNVPTVANNGPDGVILQAVHGSAEANTASLLAECKTSLKESAAALEAAQRFLSAEREERAALGEQLRVLKDAAAITTASTVAPTTTAVTQSHSTVEALRARIVALESLVRTLQKEKEEAAAEEGERAKSQTREAAVRTQQKPPANHAGADAHRGNANGAAPAANNAGRLHAVAHHDDPPRSHQNPTFHGVLDSAVSAERAKGTDSSVTPLLIFAYNRAQSLQRAIDSVLRRMPRDSFRLFVSQDGNEHPDVSAVIARHAAAGDLHRLIHKRSVAGARPEDTERGWLSYYAIAHHYKFAIGSIFSAFPFFDKIILLEEDMVIGADFFSYMSAVAPVLASDRTLLCASAWNDNGRREFASNPTALYRSDFFPGLGWMTTRAVWDELAAKWPNGFWDDWMRQPVNRRGRACIRPEVSRVSTLCDEQGASGGQFCDHIAAVRLVTDGEAVDWAARGEDLRALAKAPYDARLRSTVGASTVVPDVATLLQYARRGESARLAFGSNAEFVAIAEALGIMADFKDGVPRTAYKGVVTVRIEGTPVHLFATYRYTADAE